MIVQRHFLIKLIAGAMFLVVSVSELSPKTWCEDIFDVVFKQVDKNPQPGPLYRVKLALSPKFVSMFGDEQEQSRVLRFARTRLSLRNPEVAQIASLASETTSEEKAKELLAKITAKYNKILQDTELELQTATSEQQWDALRRVQVGLLGPLFVLDKQLVEFFELTDEQQESLREILAEFRSLTAEADDAGAAQLQQRDRALDRMKALFDDKQRALLERCLVASRELVEYEELRMNSPEWLSDRSSQGESRELKHKISN